MRLETVKHEDYRRSLIEFVGDLPLRTAKVLYVKEEAVLGSHYHKLKDDVFFLIKGSGTVVLDNHAEDFRAGDCLHVKAGIKHSFTLHKGSILLEASTTPYDKTDEYKA